MFDFHFDWNPEFNTNIEIVDTHHKQLFKIGRDIEQLIQNKCIGVTDKQLLDIICDLREFTGYHFYEEERIMKENDYPGLEEHRREHYEFSEKISNINMPNLKKEPEIELAKIMGELKDNLFTHILLADKKMAVYVLNHKNEAEIKKKGAAKFDEYEDLYGIKICELDVTKVYLFHEQSYRGRVVLVYKDPVTDMGRLAVLERNIFFSDVAKITKALQKLYKPDGFNYGSFSDVNSQLHMHIVPKYKAQSGWGEIFNLDPKELYLTKEEMETMALEIKKEVG